MLTTTAQVRCRCRGRHSTVAGGATRLGIATVAAAVSCAVFQVAIGFSPAARTASSAFRRTGGRSLLDRAASSGGAATAVGPIGHTGVSEEEEWDRDVSDQDMRAYEEYFLSGIGSVRKTADSNDDESRDGVQESVTAAVVRPVIFGGFRFSVEEYYRLVGDKYLDPFVSDAGVEEKEGSLDGGMFQSTKPYAYIPQFLFVHPIILRDASRSLAASMTGNVPHGATSVPSLVETSIVPELCVDIDPSTERLRNTEPLVKRDAIEAAIPAEWEAISELEIRIRNGANYEHVRVRKGMNTNDGTIVPSVFCGYRVSEEEYLRLKDADATAGQNLGC